jgi:undecaprenyl-diphosphatase
MTRLRMTDLLNRPIAWLGTHELATLIGIALLAAGCWSFVAIANAVFEGDTESADRAILLAMRSPGDVADPIGAEWLEELSRDFTALGGVGVLTFVTLAVLGYLLLERKTKAAIVVLIAVAGGLAASQLLKVAYDRPRPELVPHGSHVYTASFPSGHAMMSAATYLTLGALLARVHSDRRLKAYFLVLALVLTAAVGISRVYLGVHWPTDVLAGWTLGASWAIACWLFAVRLQRRGEMEVESGG